MTRAVQGWIATLVAAFALVLGSGCVTAAGRQAGLPHEPAMVVVAPAKPSADDQASETYADWAGYLNDFSAAKPAGLTIARMTPVRWRALVATPAPRDDYATVFLRGDGQALVYDGMVVEPQVYQAGAGWAKGGATPDAASGLTRTMLKKR